MATIVHFGKYYLPDLGGIESVTVGLAQGAAVAGHSVSVICFQKAQAKAQEVIERVSVIRTPIWRVMASQPLGWKYFRSCLTAASGADIVHLHAPNMLAGLCALLMGKRPRLVVHWHSDVLNKGALGRLVKPLETALLRRADVVVATSKVYALASSPLAPFMNKVKIVPIGVAQIPEPQHASALPAELAAKINGRKIVLAVGRLVPYKGFEVLIEAAKSLSDDAVVVIVGGGPLNSELSRTIDRSGLGDRVILAGRVSDGMLHALFAHAALYCMSSTYRAEAFGVVLVEAMAHGLPIVATDIAGSGVPWVNEHGVSGLNVPVNQPKLLAHACNEILGSSELRGKLSCGARQRYEAEFTEQTSVERMLNIYAGLNFPATDR